MGLGGGFSFSFGGFLAVLVGLLLGRGGGGVGGVLLCGRFANWTAGTLPDGTVRMSLSAFNRAFEIDAMLFSLREVAAARGRGEIS